MTMNPEDDKIMSSSTLDALLTALSVDVEAFALCEIAENVRLVFPPMDVIEVHHVLEGTLFLTIGDDDPIEAPAGAMVIVPPGRLQYLAASRIVATSKVSSDVLLPVREGMVILDATEGAGAVLRIACGTVQADPNGSYGPLDGLSQPIAEDLSDAPIVSAAFRAMLEEVAAPEEGAMALTSALMKACLVVLLRRHLQSSRETGTPPALFSDARIGRAIAAILDCPSACHSVTSLAREAGMEPFRIRARLQGDARRHADGVRDPDQAQSRAAPAGLDGPLRRSHCGRGRLQQPEPLQPRLPRSLWNRSVDLPPPQLPR